MVSFCLGKSERVENRRQMYPRHGGFFVLQLHDELLYEVAEDSMVQVRGFSSSENLGCLTVYMTGV